MNDEEEQRNVIKIIQKIFRFFFFFFFDLFFFRTLGVREYTPGCVIIQQNKKKVSEATLAETKVLFASL